MSCVLIVDDEVDMAAALRESVLRCGLEPVVYHNPVDALSELNLADFSLIITDMKMPKMDGISFLRRIRDKGLFVPVVVITGFGTVENAVDAMKLGATDYIMKPFSFETLKKVVERILPSEEGDIVAVSPAMKHIISVSREVARSDATVLLSGESGTGKEIIARYIHQQSDRADGPFVAINCAALSESLLESELFGYERGAFTGASERRIGKFERAGGGTLLLDEISEMAYPLQAKLLRAIQEKEVDRIGGRAPVPVDVRIVATTNRDLLADVRQGRFREDLYYRLNVFPVTLPPLRQRREDIIPLAEFFLRKLSQKMSRLFQISGELESYLLGMSWEGNVRELENVLYRMAVLARSDTLLPPAGEAAENLAGSGTAAGSTMRDMERDMIIKTLKAMKGNRTKTAEVLGVSVRTIRNKIREYNITDL